MGSIARRIERVEERLGMDDRLIELDIGDEIVVMTEREFGQLLREIQGTRLLPKETYYEQPIEAS